VIKMYINAFYLFLAVLGLLKPAFDVYKFATSGSTIANYRMSYVYVSCATLLLSYLVAYIMYELPLLL